MPQNISTAFYDAMFGQSRQDAQLNELEESTLKNVRSLLNSPKEISSHIPPLPVTMIQLLELLKDPNTEFDEIAKLIDNDPSLAIEVLKVANTPMYFRGNAEITSLTRAVSLLGVDGVASIASTIMVEKIRPPKPIYYKMFGKMIWVHSLHTAYLCKQLAKHHGSDEFSGHFFGLIHDVGKIIIFNCLCQAFQQAMSGNQPGSLVFKQMMVEMSGDISTFVAEEWELPDVFVEAFKEQRTGAKSPLAKALKDANLLAELHLLKCRKLVSEEQVLSFVEKLDVPMEIWNSFGEVAVEIEMSVT